MKTRLSLTSKWIRDAGFGVRDYRAARILYLASFLFLFMSFPAHAQNVFVTNSTDHPVPITSPDQAAPGSDATKATAVQGVTGGKAVTIVPASATTVKSSALEASHVLKASAGGLLTLDGFNSGPQQFILIIDSATVPANGAVTLLYPPIKVNTASNFSLHFCTPLSAANGIVWCNSSTGTFTKTIGSADVMVTSQVQ
jgi:hypothetical protein